MVLNMARLLLCDAERLGTGEGDAPRRSLGMAPRWSEVARCSTAKRRNVGAPTKAVCQALNRRTAVSRRSAFWRGARRSGNRRRHCDVERHVANGAEDI